MSLNKVHEDFLNIERPNYIDVLGDDVNLSDLSWSTYSDTPAVNPTDGIGGTANITFAKNLTNPLSGTFDLRLTKDAANRQGQGFSIPFLVSNIHLGKVLQISFDMEFISGTYSTGDLRVYIVQNPTGTPVVLEPEKTN